MNLLFDLAHPAHVHVYKNVAKRIMARGHKVLFTASDRYMISELLQIYNFDYVIRGTRYKSIIGKIWGAAFSIKKILFISLKFKPDLYFGTLFAGIVAKILRKPYMIVGDSENGKKLIPIVNFFADVIFTGESFNIDMGEKQLRYNGYMELFYLHPNIFNPDPSIRSLLKLSEDEKYIILRFVAWDAYHDYGEGGIPQKEKVRIVETLSKYAKIFISSEIELEEDLKKYEIQIPYDRMQDALAFAEMYIGEGATMASEAAILGTPTIYINSIELGYCTELEEQYGLMFNFRKFEGVLEKAVELFKTPNLQELWKEKQKKMMSEKIDTTAFFAWFVEHYPQSHKIVKYNPNYQYKFK